MQTHHVVHPMETSAILISILYERVILHALAFLHVNGSSPIQCIIILESQDKKQHAIIDSLNDGARLQCKRRHGAALCA